MVNTTPTKTKVLVDIKAKNPTASTLTENDFDIKSESNTSNDPVKITITGKGNYTGDVTLKYAKQIVKIKLNDIIKVKDLGKIYVGQAYKPAADKIKSEIKKKNPSLDITNINISDSDITATTVKVTGDEKQYTGKVEVEFTTANFEIINAKIKMMVTLELKLAI